MMDSSGRIVVYIGQPWHHPKGKLVGKRAGRLLIGCSDRVIRDVSKEGFTVSSMPYKEYNDCKQACFKWIEEQKKPCSRMDFLDI